MMTFDCDDDDRDDDNDYFYTSMITYECDDDDDGMMKTSFSETGGNSLGEVVCNPKQECATNTMEKSGLIIIVVKRVFYKA